MKTERITSETMSTEIASSETMSSKTTSSEITPSITTPPAMTQKLWNRDFTLLIINQIMSIFGNAILTFALPLYIFEVSGSPALFGTVLALSFIPLIVMSPIGGMIADRVRKQRMMFWLDAATSALIVLYALAAHGFSMYIVPIIVVKLMALNAIQGLYMPAVQASIPALSPPDKLVGANAAAHIVNSLSGMLGPAVAGVLYGTVGLFPILVAAFICFAATAALDLFMRIPYQKPEASGGIFQIISRDMRESFRFMTKERPEIAKLTLIISVFVVTSTSLIVIGLPVIIIQTLDFGGGVHYGISQAVIGAGGIIGGLLAGALGSKLTIRHSHRLLFLSSVFTAPFGLALLFDISQFSAYLIVTAAGGAAILLVTMISIQSLAFIQSCTPPALSGKVISCVMAITLCAHPLGQLLFGVLFENFEAWMIAISSAIISCGVALYSRASFKAVAV